MCMRVRDEDAIMRWRNMHVCVWDVYFCTFNNPEQNRKYYFMGIKHFFWIGYLKYDANTIRFQRTYGSVFYEYRRYLFMHKLKYCEIFLFKCINHQTFCGHVLHYRELTYISNFEWNTWTFLFNLTLVFFYWDETIDICW